MDAATGGDFGVGQSFGHGCFQAHGTLGTVDGYDLTDSSVSRESRTAGKL